MVDHFIPIYEKQVEDLKHYSSRSFRAYLLLTLDILTCWSGTFILTDTAEHATYLSKLSKRRRSRFLVVPAFSPLESELALFASYSADTVHKVVWIGGKAGFHGLENVLKIGNRVFQQTGARVAVVTTQVISEPPPGIDIFGEMSRVDLARMLSNSLVVLGVFGTSPRLDRVIPFKVLDGMAAGRLVVTKKSRALHSTFRSSGLILNDSNDTEEVSEIICSAINNPEDALRLGLENLHAYTAHRRSVGDVDWKGALKTHGLIDF